MASLTRGLATGLSAANVGRIASVVAASADVVRKFLRFIVCGHGCQTIHLGQVAIGKARGIRHRIRASERAAAGMGLPVTKGRSASGAPRDDHPDVNAHLVSSQLARTGGCPCGCNGVDAQSVRSIPSPNATVISPMTGNFSSLSVPSQLLGHPPACS